MFKKILIIIVFIFLLLTPEITASGALKGLDLWYKALIPSLMPFMFLSDVIINMNLTSGINLIMRPLTSLLSIKKEAGYAIFAGLFFGYPACAVTSIEMQKNNILDKKSAEICVCAFNNVSPAFISGYICRTVLDDRRLIIPVFVIQYLSILINAFIIRILLFKKTDTDISSVSVSTPKTEKNIINTALNNSLINIARLGGYVIIFSIISYYLLHYMGYKAIIPCMLTEITSGAALISGNNLLLLLPFMYLGGLCGIFQTFAVDNTHLVTKHKYVLSKVTGAVIAAILCLIYAAIQK